MKKKSCIKKSKADVKAVARHEKGPGAPYEKYILNDHFVYWLCKVWHTALEILACVSCTTVRRVVSVSSCLVGFPLSVLVLSPLMEHNTQQHMCLGLTGCEMSH